MVVLNGSDREYRILFEFSELQICELYPIEDVGIETERSNINLAVKFRLEGDTFFLSDLPIRYGKRRISGSDCDNNLKGQPVSKSRRVLGELQQMSVVRNDGVDENDSGSSLEHCGKERGKENSRPVDESNVRKTCGVSSGSVHMSTSSSSGDGNSDSTMSDSNNDDSPKGNESSLSVVEAVSSCNGALPDMPVLNFSNSSDSKVVIPEPGSLLDRRCARLSMLNVGSFGCEGVNLKICANGLVESRGVRSSLFFQLFGECGDISSASSSTPFEKSSKPGSASSWKSRGNTVVFSPISEGDETDDSDVSVPEEHAVSTDVWTENLPVEPVDGFSDHFGQLSTKNVNSSARFTFDLDVPLLGFRKMMVPVTQEDVNRAGKELFEGSENETQV